MAGRRRAGHNGPKRSRPSRAQGRHGKKKGAAARARTQARSTARPRPGVHQPGEAAPHYADSKVSATPTALATHTFERQRLQSLLLQFGLAFVFLYASVSSLLDPTSFTTYMPEILPASWIETVALPCFSIFEAILAVWLLVGRRLFVPSMVAAATVAGIILVNLDLFPMLFRNVTVLCAALALAVQADDAPWDRRPRRGPSGRRHTATK